MTSTEINSKADGTVDGRMQQLLTVSLNSGSFNSHPCGKDQELRSMNVRAELLNRLFIIGQYFAGLRAPSGS